MGRPQNCGLIFLSCCVRIGTAAGNRPNIQRTRRGPLALALVRFRFSHYLGGPFVARFVFDPSRYRFKYRIPLFVGHVFALASRHGLFSFHCLRFARFRAYIVGTWGHAAGYSFFKVLVGRFVLFLWLPFVLFLVLRSPLFFPLFLSIVYAQKMYMSIGDCIKTALKWEKL